MIVGKGKRNREDSRAKKNRRDRRGKRYRRDSMYKRDIMTFEFKSDCFRNCHFLGSRHIGDIDDVDGGDDDDDGGFVGGGGGGGGGIDVTRPASATSTFKSALEGPCLVCLVDNS